MIRLRLRQLLQDRKQTLYWLRKTSGVNYPTLLRYYHNRARKIDLNVLEKICAALGCEPGELLETDDAAPDRPAR